MQVVAVGEGGQGRQFIAREIEIFQLFHLSECTGCVYIRWEEGGM